MITIAVIFGLIGYFEWTYLKRNKRSKRAMRIVLSCCCLLWLGSEVVYLCRHRLPLGLMMHVVFAPLQQWLFVGG